MIKTIQGDVHKDIIIGTGITSLLFIASFYLPIVGFICTLLIPLPILFYRSKLGRKTGAIIPGLTFIVMVAFLGGISIDILLFAELLLLGFVLSELIEINLSIEKTLFYAVSIILFIGLIALLIYSAAVHKGVLVLISEYVAKNLELTLSIYERIGVSEQSLEMISKSLDQIHYVMVRTIPAWIFSGTLFVAWTSLLFARHMIISRMLFFPDFGSLTQWKAPDHLVWGVIGCSASLLLPDGVVYIVGLNGLIVLMSVYFFQGIAIVAFYFNKLGLPRIIRIILYCLMAIQQLLLLVVIGLGFFDMWLNFRRLEKEKQD